MGGGLHNSERHDPGGCAIPQGTADARRGRKGQRAAYVRSARGRQQAAPCAAESSGNGPDGNPLMKILRILTICMLAGALGRGQVVDLKHLDRLAAKASETADVTLDGSLLKLAAKFLSADEPDQAKVKKLVVGLKGIYVRTFEFENEGEYSESHVTA